MKYPKRVTVIELENAPFRCARDAIAYAKGHGIVGVMSNADTGGKGEVSISIRAKTTLKLHKDPKQPTKAYSYEISNVEVLRGNAEYAIQPSNNTPTFDVSILLNGVCDVNGEPLLK